MTTRESGTRKQRRGEAAYERKLARERAMRRRHRMRVAGAVLGAVALVGVVVALVVSILDPGNCSTLDPGNGSTPVNKVATFANLERTHVREPVSYAQRPPAGGPHNPVWQNCGFYSQPVPDETAVHSMEHGAGLVPAITT